jgi:hypothetical protein
MMSGPKTRKEERKNMQCTFHAKLVSTVVLYIRIMDTEGGKR